MYSLYVKEHNQTGLKYLGRTIQDPYKYKGSGVRWLNHIHKHGNDVSTKVIGTFKTLDELVKVSLPLSNRLNVVESDEWANLRPENGWGFDSEASKKLHSKYDLSKGLRDYWKSHTHRQEQSERKKALINEGNHLFCDTKHQKKASHSRNPKNNPFVTNNPVNIAIKNGVHSSQQIHTCPRCGKSGKGNLMVTRHINRCRGPK